MAQPGTSTAEVFFIKGLETWEVYGFLFLGGFFAIKWVTMKLVAESNTHA